MAAKRDPETADTPKARAALQRAAELVRASRDALVEVSPEGAVLAWNPAAERIYGWSEDAILGRPVSDLAAFPSREALGAFMAEVLAGRDAELEETTHRRRDGGLITVSLSAAPVRGPRGAVTGISLVIHDLAERKALQQQLWHAQKMESVGRLAGGIAHDFNNILTAIMGYTEMLLETAEAGSRGRADLEEIKKSAERAAGLTRQLLAFSRRQIMKPEPLDLNALLLDMDKVIRRLLGEDIELAFLPGRGLGLVHADPGQVQQVVLNLAVNARDAMPKGGKLTIETGNAALDDSFTKTNLGLPPGDYVLLAVSDSGCGMSEETQSRLFEPFFTTKPLGEGTGLGLSTVFGIVKQSGGHVWAYSKEGLGTTFKTYLPRLAGGPAPAAETARAKARAAGGGETILLTEDEEAVRLLASRVLSARGYQVLAASRGEEALAAAAAHHGPIHLLITDVVMPGMNGRELAERLSERGPALKVLFVSGYTEDAIVRRGSIEQGVDFLSKPFVPEELSRRVREILDRD